MWVFDCDRIKVAREVKDFTQSDLASKVGVTLQRIVQWESGEVKPSMSSLETISNVLDIAPKFFFSDSVHNHNSLREGGCEN